MGVGLIALLLNGCVFPVARYALSPDVTLTLRRLHEAHPVSAVRVSAFLTPAIPGNSMNCDSGFVTGPGDTTFSIYLRKALADELKVAGLYAEASPTAVVAILDGCDFGTFSSEWRLRARVRVGDQPMFEVKHSTPIPGNLAAMFFGSDSCRREADAFPGAAQDLITAIVQDPAFEAGLAASVRPPPAVGPPAPAIP